MWLSTLAISVNLFTYIEMSILLGTMVQFDFWCVDQHLKNQNHPAHRVLWDACHQGRLFDTMILDMLIQLGTGNYRSTSQKSGKAEQKVYPCNLGKLTAESTTLQLDKDDPYRLRFGELTDLSLNQLKQADPGFFEYAIADAIATHRLYPVLTQLAYELMVEYGFHPGRDRYEILPDAIQRYGYLSEVIQVKASIVLSLTCFRHGVNVDHASVQRLISQKQGRVEELTCELQRNYPDVLTLDRDGTIVLTTKSRTPSLSNNRLTETLAKVAEEMRRQGEKIHVPQSQGKQGGISRSVKQWSKYKDRHQFLRIWIRAEGN